MRVCTLCLALGPRLPLRGVGSRRSRTNSLVSRLIHRQWKQLRRRGFLHRVYVCLQSQHAHTKHIKYDAHSPFLRQASGFGEKMFDQMRSHSNYGKVNEQTKPPKFISFAKQ